MSITREDVIRYLERLSGEEIGQLADEILARLGAPPLPPSPESQTTMGAMVDPDEMGTPMFEVVLRSAGPDRTTVMRIVRRARGDVALAEIKALVESAPVVIRSGCEQHEADELARELVGAGAVVVVR